LRIQDSAKGAIATGECRSLSIPPIHGITIRSQKLRGLEKSVEIGRVFA
jgi:hypothetical protein